MYRVTRIDGLLADIREIAETQQGLVRASDLARQGIDEPTLQSVRNRLTRVRRDFYVVAQEPGPIAEHLSRLRAAVRSSDSAWVASHQSAAVLHELPIPAGDLDLVHLATAEWASKKSHRGIRHGLHLHPEIVPSDQIVEVQGIATVAPTIAVATSALRMPLVDGLVLADSAGHAGLTTAADLLRVARQLGRKVGNPKLRQVIAHMDPKSESPGETRARLLLVSAGFEVDSQVVVNDADGRFVARVDLKVRGTTVVVEFDGRAKFTLNGDMEEAYWRWKLRLDAIRNVGLWPVVITWRDLFVPGRVVALVQDAITRSQ